MSGWAHDVQPLQHPLRPAVHCAVAKRTEAKAMRPGGVHVQLRGSTHLVESQVQSRHRLAQRATVRAAASQPATNGQRSLAGSSGLVVLGANQ
jgi:hypothetical protein